MKECTIKNNTIRYDDYVIFYDRIHKVRKKFTDTRNNTGMLEKYRRIVYYVEFEYVFNDHFKEELLSFINEDDMEYVFKKLGNGQE